jgi:dynein heavy chain
LAKFKGTFEQYSYLWLENPEETFEKFLIENEPAEDEFLKDEAPKEGDREVVGLDPKDNPLLKGARAKIPNLDLFDERITKMK